MKSLLILLLICTTQLSFGQPSKIKVLTLGTFHFAFPNRDIKKTTQKDQIDVFDAKYQSEIEAIVDELARFSPTIIAIEKDPAAQPKIDSLYQRYRAGLYRLSRDEDEQIGFRLAARLELRELFCVNDWGVNYRGVDSLLEDDTVAYKKFVDFFSRNPDSARTRYPEDVFKTKGIKAELRVLNDETNVRHDLGNYLIGVFKYQTVDNPFFAVDFTTGWWFNRNLRIFRNIQRIDTKPGDRILVIFGAGHLDLLNIFFNASPEYELMKTNDYLK